MELLVVCAQCASEFKASGDDRFWKCASCGHDVENMKYPFLTRKVAHAKSHRGETDWEQMFDELLEEARRRVLALERMVNDLERKGGSKGAGMASPGQRR